MDYEDKLKEIFDMVGCNYEYLKNHPEENLLGRNIGLSARDLLIIYVELVNKINISIPRDLILSGKFNTYGVIAGLASNKHKKNIQGGR